LTQGGKNLQVVLGADQQKKKKNGKDRQRKRSGHCRRLGDSGDSTPHPQTQKQQDPAPKKGILEVQGWKGRVGTEKEALNGGENTKSGRWEQGGDDGRENGRNAERTRRVDQKVRMPQGLGMGFKKDSRWKGNRPRARETE